MTDEKTHIERIVHVARVAKVVKGGRRFSFSVLAIVGDGRGYVGNGLGKANEVPSAIKKATERARKDMVQVPIIDGTIPFQVIGKFGAASVVLRPASRGTGVIAGHAVRAIMEAAGIQDVLTKCIGTTNPHNVVKATFNAIKAIRDRQYSFGLRKAKDETE